MCEEIKYLFWLGKEKGEGEGEGRKGKGEEERGCWI